MDSADLLQDHFGRIHELVGDVVDGVDETVLHHRPDGRGNPIAWLVWHLTRVQDDHVAELAGVEQVWDQGWRERFALDLGHDDTGFGHSSAQVDAVRVPDPDLLRGYHEDVHAMTLGYVDRVDDTELDRVVDERWDPPVTAGVRLVSVIGDCLQHLGQAAYLKGLLTNPD